MDLGFFFTITSMGFGLFFNDHPIYLSESLCWGRYTYYIKTTNRSGSLRIDSIDKNRCRLIPVVGLFAGDDR